MNGGVSQKMKDTKSVCRNLCSELVFITRADRRAPKGILGNLEAIEERFAEILADCSFPRATAVRILTKDHELEGFVEDCRRDQQLGFFIKVRLAPQSRWSEQWFTPLHLLKLWSGTHANHQPKVSTLKAASGY
jgi:hypothetical protein